MDRYKTYLATKVLNEGQVVTYRTLSRALKVHVNLAKQMLYAFYTSQSSKDPSSISATYLLCGTIRPASTATQKRAVQVAADAAADDDVVMDSSPGIPSSWMQETPSDSQPAPLIEKEHFDPADALVPTKHVVLVRQEELEDVKAELEELLWIHVYSLQPVTPADMHVLSVANEAIARSYVRSMGKDPVAPLKGLGVIENANAKWREVKNSTTSAAPMVVSKPAAPTSFASKPAPTLSRESSASKAKGGIMSSFAKTQPKGAKKAEAKATPAKPASPKEAKANDTPNFSDDDDDDDDEEIEPAVLEQNAVKAAAARKDRVEREAKLKAMMDDDDDDDSDTEMQDAPAAEPADTTTPSPTEEVDTSAALDAPAAAAGAKAEETTVSVGNGRRRGRRQVRKKRTFQDEDGYLVTKEEMEWESFSEDDTAKQPAKKMKPFVSSAGAKKKAGAAGPKQGNIMAFFGKR